MEFLNSLWDETLAGPAPSPEVGLAKLRKYYSFSGVGSTTPLMNITAAPDEASISRTVTILRSSLEDFRHPRVDLDSPPSSPAVPTTPTSPFSPTTPSADFERLTRRKSTPERLESEVPRTRSPTVYDWIVMSGLDC
ncbi:dormancy-associated protein homolog 4-like [Diospyros lotus]|uniref:dormancy-associated protein homolog 4-like n=1 Tax=Diospyros lotus TaxID=55363 RepID=UPI00225BF492|nr:dormancy-associated protein homolog 4-like [Diospyros lotus]